MQTYIVFIKLLKNRSNTREFVISDMRTEGYHYHVKKKKSYSISPGQCLSLIAKFNEHKQKTKIIKDVCPPLFVHSVNY